MFNLRNLTEREKDLLLTHFFHYLAMHGDDPAGGNNRRTIGSEYPGIYNRLHGGKTIVDTEWPFHREERERQTALLNDRIGNLEDLLTKRDERIAELEAGINGYIDGNGYTDDLMPLVNRR